MGSRHKHPTVYRVELVSAGQEVKQFGQTVVTDSDCLMIHLWGGFTLVDDSELVQSVLSGRRWNVRLSKLNAYVSYSGKRESLRLHEVLLPNPNDDGTTVDHQNRIGWDNRLSNLRHSTPTQQSRNHGPKEGKRFKGVTYDPNKKLYRARIMVDGKSMGLGRFKLEIDAAIAYDNAAREHFGEFAYLNLPWRF